MNTQQRTCIAAHSYEDPLEESVVRIKALGVTVLGNLFSDTDIAQPCTCIAAHRHEDPLEDSEARRTVLCEGFCTRLGNLLNTGRH